jgi:hypothetical protein
LRRAAKSLISCSEASTCTGGGDTSLSEASEGDSFIRVPTSSRKQRLIPEARHRRAPGRKMTPPRSNPRARSAPNTACNSMQRGRRCSSDSDLDEAPLYLGRLRTRVFQCAADFGGD